jgi:hypothetical protein
MALMRIRGKLIIAASLCLLFALIVSSVRAAGPPTVETYSSIGIRKDKFYETDDVYVQGIGYTADDMVNITVVYDKATWNDGDPIEPIVRTKEVQINSTGGLELQSIGKFAYGANNYYDIVVDTDQDRIYDAATDALDDHDVNEAGFTAGYKVPVGGIVISFDKLGLLTPYIGLASIVAVGAVVATVVYKRKK